MYLDHIFWLCEWSRLSTVWLAIDCIHASNGLQSIKYMPFDKWEASSFVRVCFRIFVWIRSLALVFTCLGSVFLTTHCTLYMSLNPYRFVRIGECVHFGFDGGRRGKRLASARNKVINFIFVYITFYQIKMLHTIYDKQ